MITPLSPEKLRTLVSKCFSIPELNYLEKQAGFQSAVEEIDSVISFENTTAWGQTLLDKREALPSFRQASDPKKEEKSGNRSSLHE